MASKPTGVRRQAHPHSYRRTIRDYRYGRAEHLRRCVGAYLLDLAEL